MPPPPLANPSHTLRKQDLALPVQCGSGMISCHVCSANPALHSMAALRLLFLKPPDRFRL